MLLSVNQVLIAEKYDNHVLVYIVVRAFCQQ